MPHADNFQFHIMPAVAAKEREMINLRTSVAIAVKRGRGESWGTNAVRVDQADAFGQSIHPHIQILLESGVTASAAIAVALNQTGVKTTRDANWGTGQVVRVIRRT
jgi:DNA invertase Pin-like site-specific DNA recombinase